MKRSGPLRRVGARSRREADALARFRLLVLTHALHSYGANSARSPVRYHCVRCNGLHSKVHAHIGLWEPWLKRKETPDE